MYYELTTNSSFVAIQANSLYTTEDTTNTTRGVSRNIQHRWLDKRASWHVTKRNPWDAETCLILTTLTRAFKVK